MSNSDVCVQRRQVARAPQVWSRRSISLCWWRPPQAARGPATLRPPATPWIPWTP